MFSGTISGEILGAGDVARRRGQGLQAFGLGGLGSLGQGQPAATGALNPGDIVAVEFDVMSSFSPGDEARFRQLLQSEGYQVVSLVNSGGYFYNGTVRVVVQIAGAATSGRGGAADVAAVVVGDANRASYPIIWEHGPKSWIVQRAATGQAPPAVLQTYQQLNPQPASVTAGGSISGSGWDSFWQGLGLSTGTGVLIAAGVVGVLLLKK